MFTLFPVLSQMLARRGGDLCIQPSIIKEIGRAIVFLKESTGMAILLVEQYLDFCRGITDHVHTADRQLAQGFRVAQGLGDVMDWILRERMSCKGGLSCG